MPGRCGARTRRGGYCQQLPCKGRLRCFRHGGAPGNGHHLINKSAATAVYLEVGSRNPRDLTTYSDIDMMSSNADGRFVHKDGTPYPER